MAGTFNALLQDFAFLPEFCRARGFLIYIDTKSRWRATGLSPLFFSGERRKI